METNKILVTIIDPQPLFREGVKTILQSSDKIEVEHEANVFKHIMKKGPIHIILIHVHAFMHHHHEITQTYLEEDSNVKIVVLADLANESEVIDAIRTGVHGYLLKDMSGEQLLDAINKIANGMIYIDATLSTIFLNHYRDIHEHQATLEAVFRPVHLYTKRECEILQLLTDGRSNNDIAAILQISEKTVKNHVSNLFKKMNVHSRTEAVIKAIKNNWVSLV